MNQKLRFCGLNLVISFLLFGLLSCNVQEAGEQTQVQLYSPTELPSNVHRLKTLAQYPGGESILFDGLATDAGFSGPWSVLLPVQQPEYVILKLQGYGLNGTPLINLAVTYRNVGGKLLPDPTVQFFMDSVAVALASGTYTPKWISLPKTSTPILTIANPAIATLTETQSLQLLTPGYTEIILSVPDLGIADTLFLKVHSGEIIPDPIVVFPDSVRIFKDSLTLITGIDDYPLNFTAYPSQFQTDVTCASSLPAVVSVSGNKFLTPLTAGDAQVICTITNSTQSDTLRVHVKGSLNPTVVLDSIQLSLDTLILFTDKPAAQLTYTLFPVALEAEILWSISKPIAEVSETGLVTPKSAGSGWVSVIAVGSKVVKDSLFLSVKDTTALPAQWKRDTLTTQVQEGQSARITLVDSVNNPSSAAIQFVNGGLNTRVSLASGIFSFNAAVNDSGDYYHPLFLQQGDSQRPVVIHVKVLPTYVTLQLGGSLGEITAVPAKPQYRLGERVTLIPAPSVGTVFTGWSGDVSGSNPNFEILMDADKSVTALFTPGTAPTCTEILSGQSLNTAIRTAYGSANPVTTLCPAPNGIFDANTIQVLGRVEVIITQ
jgi:hypothetical protein